MSEKRYSVQSGYVVDLVTGNLLNCHNTRNLLNTQAAEIAGLRKERLQIAETLLRHSNRTEYDLEEIAKNGQWYPFGAVSDQNRDDARLLLRLTAELYPEPNPSEIPNSSEFLVTEADQREADKAIADGSAKLKMPETGHGIMEVQDAAEGG